MLGAIQHVQNIKVQRNQSVPLGHSSEHSGVFCSLLRLVLEPYAMKVARTVLTGGKPERAYLSEQTL